MRNLNLISYFGGKYPHLNWLVKQFPTGNFHFVDIMCGSANVALNVNYPLVTINDRNENVVNLFEVLRTRQEDFLRAIYYTPFSRTELERIITGYYQSDDPVEKARQYFVRSQLGFGANGSQNNHMGFGLEYKVQKSNFSRVDNWNSKLKKIEEIAAKLRGFQIESRDVFELFSKVNTAGNIVYFDPPYSFEVRCSKKRYQYEWDEADHYKLRDLVADAKCHIAISGYDSESYRDLFSHLTMIKNKPTKSSTKKKEVTECLWVNYDIEKISGKIIFPD